jgi:iron complex transport system substrate-binding protein
MKYGGAVVGGGLLAGCAGQGDGGTGGTEEQSNSDTGGTDSGNEPTESDDETDDSTESADEEATETGSNTPYEACIEPVGCLTFEEVPETYVVYHGGWADMAFALGQQDGLLAASAFTWFPPYVFEPFDLDVPSADEFPSLWADGWDKEQFFELDPDVFLIDPEFLHGVGWDSSWDEADTEEIEEKVAPFFGNSMRRRREFHDYKLYPLYEGLERLADLFQEHERYEAFVELHEEVQTTISERLPPEDERPEVALMYGSNSNPKKGNFSPLYAEDEGYEMKPYRDLEVESAFSESLVEGGEIDYERLLDVDPEIIIFSQGIQMTGDTDSFSPDAFRERFLTPMQDDPVGSELSAVQEGNIYPGPLNEQGPIVNLLHTEMVAQQLYPEEFGAFDPESFPQVPQEQQLFDRQWVTDIINGDI